MWSSKYINASNKKKWDCENHRVDCLKKKKTKPTIWQYYEQYGTSEFLHQIIISTVVYNDITTSVLSAVLTWIVYGPHFLKDNLEKYHIDYFLVIFCRKEEEIVQNFVAFFTLKSSVRW